MNFDPLKDACRGTVLIPNEEGFAEALHRGLWNELRPDRTPQVIVQTVNEDDIIAAIRFAKEHRLKVVIRGGGHNWCQPTLRQGGMLIDISALAGVISIDEAARKAVIRPFISNREIQLALNPKGLAFPSGHCPQVKASGYLLSGGMAWNPTVWGSGAESVEAIELVTADGELITASPTENVDYFWAARGAGPGFFGVVTKYHLRLQTLPRAIHSSSYYYLLKDAPAVGKWLGSIAPTLSPSIELSLFVVQAPAELLELAQNDGGWVGMATAVAFEETAEAAEAVLQPLESSPVAPIASTFALPQTFEQLFDSSGALWPEGLRSRVEAAFSNSCPGEVLAAILDQLRSAPSLENVFLFTIFCGSSSTSHHPMAHSMSGKIYGGPWTMWRDAKDDQINADWHRELLTLLRPYNAGYYIGESNMADRPACAVEAYSPAHWQRLCDLRVQYDPQGLFFNYFEGFNPDR